MSRYSRTELADMTVAEIKQFCRDNSITGYSRYTRKADLIEYVYWTLDSIEEMLEENLLADPISTDAIATEEIHPDAIATGEIHPDAIASTQINPDSYQGTQILEKTDQYESSAVIPELSQTYAESITGLSPGYPSGIPRVSCEYPRVMPGLCTDYEISMRGLCADHQTAMIDRYPKSSHGINSSFPGSRINPVLTQHDQVRGLSQ